MRRAVLIYNPKSGRQMAARVLPAVLDDLRAGGFDVEPRPTAGPGDATRLAREAVGDGVEVAFAMGGDGTLREASAGLLGSDVVLGPLPAGTANVLALALGLPRRARAAARVLPGCAPQTIDVGTFGAEPFLMNATGGLDAAVMSLQDGTLKKLLGRAGLAPAVLRQWLAYDYPPIELRVDGRRERVSYFAACNIPYYGSAIEMAPGADFRDGFLDLLLFHGSGPVATLGLGRDLLLGRHLRRPDVEVRRVAELELLGPPGVPIQIDGDLSAVEPPVRIALGNDQLRVLAPPL